MSEQTIVVQEGDTMVSIAFAHGYRSWEGIYNHPRNATLRELCPDPTLLRPGTAVFLPAKGTVSYQCATTRRHVFRVKSLKARLRFSVGDETRAFVNARYELRVDGTLFEGTTDGEGVIEELVRPDAARAAVKVWPDGDDGEVWEWSLHIGHLDPIDTDTGVRERLANLGYGAVESEEALTEALEHFQYDAGLEVTGVLDAPTLDRLRDRSGT